MNPKNTVNRIIWRSVNSMGELKLSDRNCTMFREPLTQSSNTADRFLGKMSTTTGWKYVVIVVQLNRNMSKLIGTAFAIECNKNQTVGFAVIPSNQCFREQFQSNEYSCLSPTVVVEFFFFFLFNYVFRQLGSCRYFQISVKLVHRMFRGESGCVSCMKNAIKSSLCGSRK